MINTSEDIHDPLTSEVYVVGLNGWVFILDAAGSTATCEGEPTFFLVGSVPRDKIALFSREWNPKWSCL